MQKHNCFLLGILTALQIKLEREQSDGGRERNYLEGVAAGGCTKSNSAGHPLGEKTCVMLCLGI